MPVYSGNEDLRSRKTEKALNSAIISLLGGHNFRKITVRDICVEAQVSRATFYAHFTDKYDLLKYWLEHLRPKNVNTDISYEQTEIIINQLVNKNRFAIKNLIDDANDETLEIIFDYVLSTLNLTVDKNEHGTINPKYVILSNFYAGGMVFYLYWQVKNKFPSDVKPMNMHLYEIIEKFQEWNSE